MKKYRILAILSVLVFAFAVISLQAATKTPPKEITFKTKFGNVVFPHAEHIKLEKQNCKACHDKLFKQDETAPLDFKPMMHKKAEKDKTSCGACHNPDGPSFQTKGNCAKCHQKKG